MPVTAPVVDNVVAALTALHLTADAERGPAATDIVVYTARRTYGFVLVDDDATQLAAAWDGNGPFESGPVADALEDYIPAIDPNDPLAHAKAIADVVAAADALAR